MGRGMEEQRHGGKDGQMKNNNGGQRSVQKWEPVRGLDGAR